MNLNFVVFGAILSSNVNNYQCLEIWSFTWLWLLGIWFITLLMLALKYIKKLQGIRGNWFYIVVPVCCHKGWSIIILNQESKQTNNLTMGHLMYYYTTGSSTFKIIVCHKIQRDNCTVNFFPILSALTLPDAVPALIWTL